MMKRIALIDNATLTACQRLLGDSKVANLYNIDGDIAATEGLIQAFLFCDEIVSLDDYKEEYRKQRRSRFDFINFLAKDQVEYETSMTAARNSTHELAFRVRGHEIDKGIRGVFRSAQNAYRLQLARSIKRSLSDAKSLD